MDRADSLPCQHPNVLGCPNHGPLARALWRRLLNGDQVSAALFVELGNPEQWPIQIECDDVAYVLMYEPGPALNTTP